MPPLVHLGVMGGRAEASFPCRDDGFDAFALEQVTKMVRVISLVRQQGAKRQALDQLFRAGDFASLPRHRREPHKVSQSVDKRENFGRHAAPALSDRLILSPPLAPCPWRWTLLIAPSIMANSKSGSSDNTLNMRVNAPAKTQRRNRLNTELELPNSSGKSRHGAPVRAIHNTASRNKRVSPPVWPGWPACPRQ